jgi:hypothetical protein
MALSMKIFAAVATLLIFLGAAPSRGASQAFDEYQVKAVFLFNFAQFVDWARGTGEDPNSPFTICVLGDDPFESSLDDTVRGESLGTHRFEVRRINSPRETSTCRILYVSSSESKQLQGILDSVKGRSILTVSDVDDFARRGGMVQFQTENKRIRLLINNDVARAARLTISSKLLRPATIVTSRGAPDGR